MRLEILQAFRRQRQQVLFQSPILDQPCVIEQVYNTSMDSLSLSGLQVQLDGCCLPLRFVTLGPLAFVVTCRLYSWVGVLFCLDRFLGNICVISMLIPVFEVCSVFSNRVLPSSSWRKSRAMAITCVGLGRLLSTLTNSLKGSFPCPALGFVSYLQLLGRTLLLQMTYFI